MIKRQKEMRKKTSGFMNMHESLFLNKVFVFKTYE